MHYKYVHAHKIHSRISMYHLRKTLNLAYGRRKRRTKYPHSVSYTHPYTNAPIGSSIHAHIHTLFTSSPLSTILVGDVDLSLLKKVVACLSSYTYIYFLCKRDYNIKLCIHLHIHDNFIFSLLSARLVLSET